jgi:hypothetical protein
MRKLWILAVLLVLLGLPATAQTFDEFETAFAAFATGVANALPFNSMVGLGWSDAYIGQLPHFGVGVSLGFTTVPLEAMAAVETAFGINLAATLPDAVLQLGAPLPAAVVEARIGGLLLPFDAGIKIGFLPEPVKGLLPPELGADYLLVGADVRFPIVKGRGPLPEISVGGGYNYMKGSLALSGILGGPQTITDVAGHTVSLTDPALNFNWQASVIDLKAQASMSLFIVTPYLGAGASFGIAQAGGGLQSDVLFDGAPITQADIDLINTLLGEAAPDLSSTGILVGAASNGWSFRAFGGLSLNVLILKIDVMGMYNFTSGSLGGSVNLRVQL